jgi:hypothetical protein
MKVSWDSQWAAVRWESAILMNSSQLACGQEVVIHPRNLLVPNVNETSVVSGQHQHNNNHSPHPRKKKQK